MKSEILVVVDGDVVSKGANNTLTRVITVGFIDADNSRKEFEAELNPKGEVGQFHAIFEFENHCVYVYLDVFDEAGEENPVELIGHA